MEIQIIQNKIHEIRDQKVMLDYDLAELYGVETRRLKESVKRNIQRFPIDFMFELTKEEYNFLRTQFATLENGRGKYTKYLPYAFTEQGVAMLSGILRSEKAIEINIEIMRAFVMMRKYALTYKEITKELHKIEGKFKDVYQALDYLLKKDEDEIEYKNRTKIGYKK